ncbi:MAG: S24 family peptidase [Ignavibacteria bacterium]|jgi:SOS-response transcriptional repressor LexA|nr:S24 family peptidase [Ignavibacteria bacterium]
MKPTVRHNFQAGNRISNILDQVANNIVLFDTTADFNNVETSCITTICSNVMGVYDCQFNTIGKVRKQTHDTFLVKISGDSMVNADLYNGDILLVDSSTQAVNNSIVLGEYNNCLCVKRIKLLSNSFVLFSENNNYPPIKVKKTDNFLIWGTVLTKMTTM